MANPDPQRARELAISYGERESCDVIFYSGPIDDTALKRLRRLCSGSERANVLLVLSTWGGDAHIAYKMGRCLQRGYEEVRVLVPSACKSAGTLLAVAGHRLIIGDDGELGPIDVQQMRQDDLWERTSGLIESAAMDSLGEISWSMFERLVAEIKNMSFGRVTFKTAADAATPIVSGVLSPIFAQIDPLKVGETTRALQIASEYARRLSRFSKNLRLDRTTTMDTVTLVSGYPDHGFVIDREEAEVLFNKVSEPDDELKALCEALGSLLEEPAPEPIVVLLNQHETDANEETLNEDPTESERANQDGDPLPTEATGSIADVKESEDANGGVGARSGKKKQR